MLCVIYLAREVTELILLVKKGGSRWGAAVDISIAIVAISLTLAVLMCWLSFAGPIENLPLVQWPGIIIIIPSHFSFSSEKDIEKGGESTTGEANKWFRRAERQ